MNRDAPVKGDTLRQDGQPEFVTVARVVKTQGRIGEVAATLLTDFPEKFATRRKLFAAKQSAGPNAAIQRGELQLQDHWVHKGMVVFKFAGVDSITDAEK